MITNFRDSTDNLIRNKSFRFISNYNFRFITENIDFSKIEKIFGNIKQSKIVIIDHYESLNDTNCINY